MAGSAAASLWSWRAPVGYPAPDPPPALPRATEQERALARARAEELARALAALSDQLGAPPAADALESLLPGGLPDNPLVPGRGSLSVACPPVASGAEDWVWCPEQGRVLPGGDQ